MIVLIAGVAIANASKGVRDTFGTQGSGNGEFETPRGVAVNETGAGGVGAGEVYVVDDGNSRIQRFDAAGNYLGQFGTAGSSPGQLSAPTGIAVDQTTGDVYVTEAGNTRVQRFDADGDFLAMWGAGVNQGGGAPASPGDICTAAHVANGDTCGAGSVGALGGQLGAISAPEFGVSVAPAGAPNAGDVLVADPGNSRVQEFEPDGDFVRAFGWDVTAPDGDDAFEVCAVAADCLAGDTGSSDGQFGGGEPVAVAEDSGGAIYALERSRLQKLTPQVGPPELNPAGAVDPTDLTGDVYPLVDVRVGAPDNVFVVRTVPAGASTCPDGTASSAEQRVLELDSAGVLQGTHLACSGLGFSTGFGLNAVTGTMYVSSTTGGAHQVYILDDISTPTASALAPTDVQTTSATFEGTVNPQGTSEGDKLSVSFELSADGGSTWERLASQDVDPGTSDVPVSFTEAGLEPNAEYRYRVVAAKAFGNPAATSAPVMFTTNAVPPSVGPGATTAAETSAVLRGQVNPHNEATTYHFEYGPTVAYGSVAPAPDASAGSGGDPVDVAQQIKGLQQNTTYHYRLVATNATGTTNSADRTLTTGPGLPDGRRYELVSTASKQGSDVMSDASRTRAAVDGGAVQFLSSHAFGDAQGTGITTEYMTVRGADGWKTHSLTPLHDPQPIQQAIFGFDPRYVGELSPDDNTGVYLSGTQLTSDGANVASVKKLYLRRNMREPGAGDYELLTDAEAPVTTVALDDLPAYAGSSSDFSHVIFTYDLNLTSTAPAQDPLFCGGFGFCQPRLYEHTAAGVRLVGLIPVAPATSCTGLDCVPAVRSIAGRASRFTHYSTDTISADGRRIFFTVSGSAGGRDGAIYLREDGTTTFKVNASERTVPETPERATFWAASSDGSKVFFTTTEPLVDGDTSGTDLYRWDRDAPAGHRLTLISVDEEPGDAPGEAFDVYGSSDDGSYVYFTVTSQLVAGKPLVPTGEHLLFAWHEGEVSYVGALTVDDTITNIPVAWTLSNQTPRVTPDGKHLLFVSSSTHQPTVDSSVDCGGGVPCRRVYVYNADANGGAGELACASCRPDGAPSASHASYVSRVGQGGAVSDAHLNRAISADGRRIFFNTGDSLVDADHNGTKSDVYMYDVPSGQVHLISDGTGEGSYFMDASADGSDVFFTTREQLVGADRDDNIDLYDARIGGGFPEPPPPAEPCAGGDACKGTATTPPLDTDPGSLAFHGPGNTATDVTALFQVQGFSSRQLRRLAAGSRAALAVRVSERGRVSVRMRGRLGGRIRLIDTASTLASHAGTVRVRLALSARARAQLRRDGRLRLLLTVRYGPVEGAQRQVVTLFASQGGGR